MNDLEKWLDTVRYVLEGKRGRGLQAWLRRQVKTHTGTWLTHTVVRRFVCGEVDNPMPELPATISQLQIKASRRLESLRQEVECRPK